MMRQESANSVASVRKGIILATDSILSLFLKWSPFINGHVKFEMRGTYIYDRELSRPAEKHLSEKSLSALVRTS